MPDQHVLGEHLFGYIMEDDGSLTPGRAMGQAYTIYRQVADRVKSRFVPNPDKRSVVDILAELGKTPDEIRQLMRTAAEEMAEWCKTAHVAPTAARGHIRDAALAVLKGRRFSGATPKRATDKIVSKIMRTYTFEYRVWLADLHRKQEREGPTWRTTAAERKATRLKKRWKGRRRGKR